MRCGQLPLAVPVTALLLLSGPGTRALAQDTSRTDIQFESLYAEWVEALGVPSSSSHAPSTDTETYRKIVALGPRALPLIIKNIKEDQRFGHTLSDAALEISKVRPKSRPAAPFILIHPDGSMTCKGGDENARDFWSDWWDVGVPRARAEYEKLVKLWQAEISKGNTVIYAERLVYDQVTRRTERIREFTELGAIWNKIRDMGVVVLPYLVEDIQQGDYAFLAMIDELTDGEVGVMREDGNLVGSNGREAAEVFLNRWKEIGGQYEAIRGWVQTAEK